MINLDISLKIQYSNLLEISTSNLNFVMFFPFFFFFNPRPPHPHTHVPDDAIARSLVVCTCT